MIYSWSELKELADEKMDSARTKLLDILSNYKAIKKCNIIVVFDAYRVKGHREEMIDYNNIHVVFTKEAQTADQYIEKFSYDYSKEYNIVVATSDYLQQIIVRGSGSTLMSARELKLEVENAHKNHIEGYLDSQAASSASLEDSISKETKSQMEAIKKPSDNQ